MMNLARYRFSKSRRSDECMIAYNKNSKLENIAKKFNRLTLSKIIENEGMIIIRG